MPEFLGARPPLEGGLMRSHLGLALSMGLGCASCGGSASADAFTNSPDASPDAPGSEAAAAPSLTRGPDGGSSTDAGPGGTVDTLACGATACALPAETCCVTNDTKTNTFGFSCTSGASCKANAGAVTLECSGPANCAGGSVCCVAQTSTGETTSACRPTCASGGGVDRAILCDPAAPSVGCPAGAPCSASSIDEWSLPNGFGTCGGKGN